MYEILDLYTIQVPDNYQDSAEQLIQILNLRRVK